MTPSIRGHRRAAVLFTGTAAACVLVLTGCGTGQIAETALKSPSINGVNVDSSDGSISLRDLSLPYPGTEGYPAGGDAPVEVAIYNNTDEAISVRVGSAPVEAGQETLVGAGPVVLGADTLTSAAPTPERSPTPSPTAGAQTGRPALIELPARSWARFTADSAEPLRVTELAEPLTAGRSVNLVFEFSDGSPALTVPAPVTMPLSPAPRAPTEHGVPGH